MNEFVVTAEKSDGEDSTSGPLDEKDRERAAVFGEDSDNDNNESDEEDEEGNNESLNMNFLTSKLQAKFC